MSIQDSVYFHIMKYYQNLEAETYGRRINCRISELRLIIIPPISDHTSTPYIGIIFYNPVTNREDTVKNTRCWCLAAQKAHRTDAVDCVLCD